MQIELRSARPDEAEHLSEIARLAKAHWGAQIDRWREAFLTVARDYIAAHWVWVATDSSDRAIAFAALKRAAAGDVLERLWVLPAYMRLGLGRRLFQRVATESPAFAFTSDLNADDFYCRLGACIIGQEVSDY